MQEIKIIIKPDGSMARLPDLLKFARVHKLKIVTIADLIRYRLKKEKLMKKKELLKHKKKEMNYTLTISSI
jgi:hypothetical protein